MSGPAAPLRSQPVLGNINARLERELQETLRTATGCSPILARLAAGALVSTIRDCAADRRRAEPPAIAAEVESHLDRFLATS